MTTARLEAFTDGVMAILITIMVLELRTPAGADFEALREALPPIGIYALSFVFLGIYWNNHHHMLHAASQLSGLVLWANLHLLFWLSLIPFTTVWTAQSGFAPLPTAVYGAVLLLAAVAYTLLLRALLACQPPGSLLEQAVGGDFKGNLSLASYAIAIPITFVNRWIALGLFVFVAMIWFLPDRRIESRLAEKDR
jgi:uncharacterized membrane protein